MYTRHSSSPPHNTPRFMRRGPAAKFLGVGVRTLDGLVRAGIIPVSRLSARLVLFDVRDLERAVAERKQGGF